ncbi:MAG: hypothetical protein WKF75_07925 [Singulisphaera sp.]
MAVETNAHPVTSSPDGQFVAAGLYSGEVVDWDVATGKLEWTLSGHKAWSTGSIPPGRQINRDAPAATATKFSYTSPLMLSDS